MFARPVDKATLSGLASASSFRIAQRFSGIRGRFLYASILHKIRLSGQLTSFKALMKMEPIVSTDTILKLVYIFLNWIIQKRCFSRFFVRFVRCCSLTERRRLTDTATCVKIKQKNV